MLIHQPHYGRRRNVSQICIRGRESSKAKMRPSLFILNLPTKHAVSLIFPSFLLVPFSLASRFSASPSPCVTNSMKIVIIKAFAAQGSLETEILGSYVKHIHALLPEASVQVCRPISGDELPDPAQHDLLIVTGGAFDLLTTEPAPWVHSILELVRTLDDGRMRGPKLLGICWGQQVVQLALGGRLGALSEGPRVRCTDYGHLGCMKTLSLTTIVP